MRMIPQLIRQWTVMQSVNAMPIGKMMDWIPLDMETRTSFIYPQLVTLKRMVLHDREKAIWCCEDMMEGLENGTFKWLYQKPKEQGKAYDPCKIFEEDLANTTMTKYDWIVALRELIDWIREQQDYKYCAEIEK